LDTQIIKLPLTILRGARFEGTISVGQTFLPPNQGVEKSYKSFESLYWNLSGANAIVSGPVTSGTGPHETICMESTYPSTPPLITARCMILHGRWDADFIGEKKDFGTFLEIIQKIE